MIIFGFKDRTVFIGRGIFYCLNCRCNRNYTAHGLRRWFTIFFVPLFPVGETRGKSVRCDACGGLFASPGLPSHITSTERVSMVQGSAGAEGVELKCIGNHEITGDAKFCPECGGPVFPKLTSRRLSKNGHPLDVNYKFCPECGATEASTLSVAGSCPSGRPMLPEQKYCPERRRAVR